MSSGITTQAMRRHRSTLVGPAITQVVAAMIIGGMTTAQESVNSSLTIAQRLERPDVLEFIDAAEVFLGDAIILAIVIIGVTMSLAMTRQLEDIALLRSVGATPGQIRRSAVL
jgi:putative ABC transport system permease protein